MDCNDITLSFVMQLHEKILTYWSLNVLKETAFSKNWCQIFHDACVRLENVETRLETNTPIKAEYDGKIIDTCLLIIEDYEKSLAQIKNL